MFCRKKVFIYSQGIGPINSNINRRLTSMTLKKAAAIVVRDEASKEFLGEIGVDKDRVVVTADPVLRIKPAPLEIGEEILRKEGIEISREQLTVGFAIRERKLDSDFMDELCRSIEKLVLEKDAQIVLIPFHYSEDIRVIEEIERRMEGKVELKNRIFSVKHKYLTNEMLSIIGNMDLLVGVRLHALIHSAIMNVPMIGISYDPKVNSFLKSIGMKAMCSIYDFDCDDFIDVFEKTIREKDAVQQKVQDRLVGLIRTLDTNEEMIKKMMEK